MRNDLTKTGDELIAAEREKQIMGGFTISSDAAKYRRGELVNLALALIHKSAGYAKGDFPDYMIDNMLALPDEDRLIIAGSLLAAQVDVLNYYTDMARLMEKNAAANVQTKIIPPTN